ncbi:3-keto-5-aminohexanoate cleavage protein [Actinokineospora sp. NBRC 105648]|uniref:3-keto-5-aminohexanoate cleavage protein n=1 Tax=Actinokineospora sp. NBRC 105648 TaxID=3032206 RepID=UPI0024A07C1C|nr:3-keto-5-aminohexanoate cleavage protein [Actinokineospora sp. NBRC 105648]GLZ41670.1 hypothetical protein Acsp05_52940 [Actinokineospora sp. NBRC 105648]
MRPTTVQVCLNGGRSVSDHPAVPITAGQLVEAVVAVAELGVTAVHVHPRDATGSETLVGSELAGTVAAVRAAAPGVAIGVTTGAWIEPDPVRRVAHVRQWVALAAGKPDFASVNVHEPGWLEVCAALHAVGIGTELGVFHTAAAATLRAAGVPAGAVRVLAEVQVTDPITAVVEAAALVGALDWATTPILLHGEGPAAWPVLEHARRHALLTRIGLEDTLDLPDGTRAPDNTALVRAAATR